MMRKKTLNVVLFYCIASIFGFFALLPFFWMISTSFKESGALIIVPIRWIPEKFSIYSYEQLFIVLGKDLILRSILNSTFVSVMVTLITLLSASMAAYAFAKIEFKLKDKIFALYLATMMIPGQVTSIPIYLVLRKLDLIDSFTGLIIPTIFNAFAVFLLRQNMNNIHNDFIDAAIIDGSSHPGVFKNVIVPLSAPILASLGVITFMGTWNDYYWPLIILNSKMKMTLPLALNLLNGQYNTRHNILMAGSLISMVPIILIYLFAQKYFETGLQVGGLKA
ncbi:MAG: sugar ABC transporter permease [Clostridiales bacterium GWC2_40_7]|nr:MAG: sugar ABC transporter permease [Clostridiales bacterium GWC2_40_7]